VGVVTAALRVVLDQGEALRLALELDEPHTELGHARRFAAAFGDRFRYVHAWRQWLVFDGRRYTPDDSGEALRCAGELARALLQQAVRVGDTGERKAALQAAQRAETARGIAAILTLAAAEPPIAARADDFDADPQLLNCANGVLDLRTLHLQPHRPDLLVTKVTRAAYLPDAPAPAFTAFLDRIQPDPSMRAYLARYFGHALSGEVREHVLGVFHGTGSNGKSTLVETMLAALGDYAITTDPGLLIDRGDVHPTGVADLFRRRLAVTHETDAGRRLAEGTVKRLTGGDRIKARRMKEDFWEFEPSHTVVMVTNHRPVVRGDDEGIWRRVRLIPFEVVVSAAEQDPDLRARLAAEIDGVLAWAVAGYSDWQANGLSEPERVVTATADYRHDSDALGRFLDEQCLVMAAAHVQSSALFSAWTAWARIEGIEPGSNKALTRALIDRGHEPPVRTNRGAMWRGIGLTTDTEQEPTP